MNKSEALAVLHEIYDVCRESVIITCVSLDIKQVERANVGYQIRIKCDLDNPSRRCITTVLEKHQLDMKEQNGFVTILPLTRAKLDFDPA